MLASFRMASRYAWSPRTCRLASTTVNFPNASGPHSMSDPQPDTRGRADQPSSSNNSPQVDQIQGSPAVPSAAASPPPPPSEALSHPFAGAKEYAENQEATKSAVTQSNLPALPQQGEGHNTPHTHVYATPPFDTHRFFRALESSFPGTIANSLMRATRALLVDRIGRVKGEALSVKDLENQAYLFRAALSEARNEISLRQRNDSAAIRTSLAALRREIDNLDGKMKTDISNLKHELQMDVDNRKTESKTDLKQMDIAIEDILNRAIVSIGGMRTMTEQMKWENMYRSVLALGAFAFAIVVIFEFNHAMKPPSPPKPAADHRDNQVLEGLELQMT